MQNLVTGRELQDMVRHWLRTPINGYLGSSYGSNLPELLQQPMMSGLADAFINKMREDIPLIGALPAGTVNVYFADRPGRKDAKDLLIEVAGNIITINVPTGTNR